MNAFMKWNGWVWLLQKCLKLCIQLVLEYTYFTNRIFPDQIWYNWIITQACSTSIQNSNHLKPPTTNKPTIPCPPSFIYFLHPAPCSPANVTFRGSTASAVLSWYDSVFATYYTVYDNRTAPPSQLCNLTELTCSLTEVPHGSVLITASNAAGESDSAPVERGRCCLVVF